MSLLAKSKGEVTYKELSGFHKWFLIILVSMGSSIIYTPVYLKKMCIRDSVYTLYTEQDLVRVEALVHQRAAR